MSNSKLSSEQLAALNDTDFFNTLEAEMIDQGCSPIEDEDDSPAHSIAELIASIRRAKNASAQSNLIPCNQCSLAEGCDRAILEVCQNEIKPKFRPKKVNIIDVVRAQKNRELAAKCSNAQAVTSPGIE